MTHEELLAKINERHWKLFNYNYQDQTLEGIEFRKTVQLNTNALRAIVELHKPKGNFADTYIDGEPTNPFCPECIDPDVYPCPTIQAIEKELK